MENRCKWCMTNQLYIDYHDNEWGVPIFDDRHLFACLTLEGAQAGLNWLTVLKKRDNYYKAFDQFNIKKIIKYDQDKIDDLLTNAGIIRNKLKIHSVVNNANKFLMIQKGFGSFADYQWQFIEGKPIINKWKKSSQIPSSTIISDQFCKDLKTRGFKFIGTTIIYAYMQAVGMVNDHLVDCYRYREVLL